MDISEEPDLRARSLGTSSVLMEEIGLFRVFVNLFVKTCVGFNAINRFNLQITPLQIG
jgi:hypothetical protein